MVWRTLFAALLAFGIFACSDGEPPVEPPCEVGELGCSCFADRTCGEPSEGERLICDTGSCVAVPCADGDLGCACLGDGGCHAGTAQCSDDNLCLPIDCTPGEALCPCDAGACAGGLRCTGEVCMESQGLPGAECLANNTCHGGSSCIDDVCVPCQLGDYGCACLPGQSCNSGMACISGVCGDEVSAFQPVPDDPACYTPCSPGATLGNGQVCSSEGLVRGCFGSTQCINGSCLEPGASDGRTCESDVDCPDFQGCTQGTCYSNCEFDSQCGGGLGCHRATCRLPCGGVDTTCPGGQTCELSDGEFGFCMPLSLANDEPKVAVTGVFSIDETQFYTVNRPGSLGTVDTFPIRFTITNNHPEGQIFTIRKRTASMVSGDGRTTDVINPMFWLQMREPGGDWIYDREMEIQVNGDGGTGTVEIMGVAGAEGVNKWEGTIDVLNTEMGGQKVFIDYDSEPTGRWQGKMYFFTNFEDTRLGEWMDAGRQVEEVQEVGNAFIQRWGSFKAGSLSFKDFRASLQSLRKESWKWATVKERCLETFDNPLAVCYPADNENGLNVLTSNYLSAPAPTGVTELPLTISFTNDTSVDAPENALIGRIVSSASMQYPGDPEFKLTLSDSPSSCAVEGAESCFVTLDDMNATVRLGGRYYPEKDDTECREAYGYKRHQVPWLVPGFWHGTDMVDGQRYKFECRDARLPYGDDPAFEPVNLASAASNPIPDGRPRVRTFKLIDGAMVNQEHLVILFQESFESFLGEGSDISAYGYALFSRAEVEIDPDTEFVGLNYTDTRPAPRDLLGLNCEADVVSEILPGSSELPDDKVALKVLGTGLLKGIVTEDFGALPTLPQADEEVHYLCEDTGLFNGGANDYPGSGELVEACPAVSQVIYFTVDPGSLTKRDIADLDCQDDGSCAHVLEDWTINGAFGMRRDPTWRCTDPDEVYCDRNRDNLLADKVFYAAATEQEVVYSDLRPTIANAFRYKTRFRSRTGQSLGFAPTLCVPGANSIPYCYDPPAIEEVRGRVDCLVATYLKMLDFDEITTEDNEFLVEVRDYLTTNFSYEEIYNPALDDVDVYDGFERLNSELLIMMGDESYTSAFSSRFDLAGNHIRSFEGELFEVDGINLSGGAGHEMHSLYQAVQYYQMVLDRFYMLAPNMWRSINAGPGYSFVTQETVTSYFSRVIRASTQKSKAWSEISKRYHNFAVPHVARAVIERAYTSAYLEAVAISRMMLQISDITQAGNRPQIVKEMENAALGYKAALLDMRDRAKTITDEVQVFGYAPDYVPFPALDPHSTNAFDDLYRKADEAMQAAIQKETVALNQVKTYDTDEANFQSELTSIRNNYENQLGDICGTFDFEGRIYPAIPKYLPLLGANNEALGDPCGFVGNGELHSAMGSMEQAKLDFEMVQLQMQNLLESMEIERQRASSMCNEHLELANFTFARDGEIANLQEEITRLEQVMQGVHRTVKVAGQVASLTKCSVGAGVVMSTDCIAGVGAGLAFAAGALLGEALTQAAEEGVRNDEREIAEIRAAQAKWETEQECNMVTVDSQTRLKQMWSGMAELKLRSLRQEYGIRIAGSNITKLRNQATRLIAEQQETEQLSINVQATKNDPNARIYKNDAILSADRTFQSALKAAYKATRVYEYYTSQSYERASNLQLIRMVQYGDPSLESYMDNLFDAFTEFEETYGNPDQRVAVLSVRDDVMLIPRIDPRGNAIPQSERVNMFRFAIKEPKLLDGRGYISLPFGTKFEQLSPMTRNHKIKHIEAEIVGSDVGDTVGRVYLTQKGTGVVRSVEGEQNYYAFPVKTAVIDTFFNGVRAFAPELYKSERLRDRPYVNTNYELIINQRDEAVNKDIDLSSLTDIRLYVYYTDFTILDY